MFKLWCELFLITPFFDMFLWLWNFHGIIFYLLLVIIKIFQPFRSTFKTLCIPDSKFFASQSPRVTEPNWPAFIKVQFSSICATACKKYRQSVQSRAWSVAHLVKLIYWYIEFKNELRQNHFIYTIICKLHMAWLILLYLMFCLI